MEEIKKIVEEGNDEATLAYLFVRILKGLSEHLTTVFTAISAFMFVLSGLYKQNIFDYYGIGHAFLKFDIQDVFPEVVSNILFICVCIGIPAFLYKINLNDSKDDKELRKIGNILLSAVYIFLIPLVINSSIEVLYLINNRIDLINNLFFAVLWSIIAVLGSGTIVLLSIDHKKLLKKTKFINLENKSVKVIKMFIDAQLSFCIVAVIFLVILQVIFSFSYSEIDKKEFDTIIIRDQAYIILTTCGDNIIVAPYSPKKQNPSNRQGYDCTIYSKSFKIVSPLDYEITHEKLGLTYVDKKSTFYKVKG